MRGNGHWGFLLAALLLFAGCSGDENNPPDDNGKEVSREKIVENGALPRWLGSSNESFIFAYQSGEGDEGVYLSDLEGNVTTIWNGPHNHDYTGSPDGQYVTFSTSELEGGIYLYTVGSGETASRIFANASHPAWLNSEHLIVASGEGGLVMIGLFTDEVIQVAFDGFAPHAPGDGSGIAYYRSGGSSGLRLYWLPFTGGAPGSPVLVSSNVALDLSFTPAGSMLVSVIDAEVQSVVVRLAATSSPEPEILLTGATDPAISGDASHLYANRISASQPGTLYYSEMSSGSLEIIADASFAAPEASGTGVLVQSDWGIERISF